MKTIKISPLKVVIFILFFTSINSQAQEGAIGIGTSNPDESAILDIQSSAKGVIFPIHNKETITNPALGLMVYDSDDNGYYFFDGQKWRAFSTAADSLWNINGDNIYSLPSKSVSIGQSTSADDAKLTVRPDDTNLAGIHIENPQNGAYAGLKIITTRENGLGLWVASHTNNGEARAGYLYSTAPKGIGVHGYATDQNTLLTNKGGLFQSQGLKGVGVHGHATNTDGLNSYGGLFESEGSTGIGVFGKANNFFGDGNRGGLFVSNGTNGIGAQSVAHGVDGIGLHVIADNPASINQIGAKIEVVDDNAKGIDVIAPGANATGINTEMDGEEAIAISAYTTGTDAISIKSTASGETGIAGHFSSIGTAGNAILANGNGDNAKTISALGTGDSSFGIHSYNSGQNGIAVYGESANNTSGTGGLFVSANGSGIKAVSEYNGAGINHGGTFEVFASSGYGIHSTAYGQTGTGVLGSALSNSTGVNRGGAFFAGGSQGIGVFARATKTGTITNYGGKFEAKGDFAHGVHASVDGKDATALTGISEGVDGIGLYAEGIKHAGLFEGSVELHTTDGSTVNVSLLEGAGFGFEFQYDGVTDNLELWSKKFSGNEAPRMTWKKNGRVGIGTEDPDEILDVVGNVKVSGNVFASCGTLSCSDKRFKTNIRSIANALELVSNLDGVYYDWKIESFPERNFSQKEQVGVIAQQLEKTFPQLVHTDESGYKSVAYDKLTPILLEAIKELNQQLIDSESNYNNLEKEVANQNARLLVLEGLFKSDVSLMSKNLINSKK